MSAFRKAAASRVSNHHVRDTHNRWRSGGGSAGGGALGRGMRAAAEQGVPIGRAVSAGTGWASGPRVAFGASHCFSAIGQCAPGSTASLAIAIAGVCPTASDCVRPEEPPPTVPGAAISTEVIEAGIAMAGRASPARQNMSAHTSSAPDHARSGITTRRDMRAMLGHARPLLAALAADSGSGSQPGSAPTPPLGSPHPVFPGRTRTAGEGPHGWKETPRPGPPGRTIDLLPDRKSVV